MILTIDAALGNRFLMFYKRDISVDELTPGCTLSTALDSVNQQIKQHGKNIVSWPAYYQDEIARLLWVNWIYQRLAVEPIRKPICTHLDGSRLMVDCGDTRLMSLSLLNYTPTVGVVCTVPVDRESEFTGWAAIHNNQDLIKAAGFKSTAQVLVRGNKQYGIEWLEIGDESTAHHLHNVNQRVNMMQLYINEQPNDFKFTVDWAKSCINWDYYSK